MTRIKALVVPASQQLQTQTLSVNFAQLFAPVGEPLATPNPQNYLAMERMYGASAWLYIATMKKARDLAQAPFTVSTRTADGTLEPVTDAKHQLVRLLAKPNPWMDMASLVRITSIWLDLTGNAFWLVFRGKDKTAREFYPINPLAVTIYTDAATPARMFRVWHFGRQFFGRGWGMPDEVGDILHFKLENPTSDQDSAFPSAWGVGPLEASWQLVTTEQNQTKWNRTLVQNDGRPSGMLMSEQEITEEESEAAADEFRKSFGGPLGAGKVLVLGKGIQYTRLAISPKEMDYTESRRDLREEIIGTFGLNSAVLGWAQGDVGRRSEQVQEYWRGTIVATSESYILPPLNQFIATDFETDKSDLVVGQDWSRVPALQQDETERWGWVRSAWSCGVRLNNLIDAYKLPIEHQPGGDKAYLPATLQEATDEPTPPPMGLPGGAGGLQALLAAAGKKPQAALPARATGNGGGSADREENGKKPVAADEEAALDAFVEKIAVRTARILVPGVEVGGSP